MSKADLIALVKHIESDVSTIIGFEGSTKGIAKELAAKVRTVIETLEGKEAPTGDAPFYPEAPAADAAATDAESEGLPPETANKTK